MLGCHTLRPESQSSASLRMQPYPRLRISFGRASCMARAASVPGLWTLGFLLLCGACGWVWVVPGLPFWLRLATAAWGVGVCVHLCARSACTPPLGARVCGVGVCAWARVFAALRHPGPCPCTHGRASRTPGARPPPQHQRHTQEDTTPLHRRTSCPCLCLQCTRAPFFSFFFRSKKKPKLGGEEEGHNHQWHTRTAHSAHTGERAPRGPGHRTRECTEGNKGTRHHGLTHR